MKRSKYIKNIKKLVKDKNSTEKEISDFINYNYPKSCKEIEIELETEFEFLSFIRAMDSLSKQFFKDIKAVEEKREKIIKKKFKPGVQWVEYEVLDKKLTIWLDIQK